MTADIVQFGRKPQPAAPGGETWLYSVHIYADETEKSTTVHIEEPGAPDVDMEHFCEVFMRVVMMVHEERAKISANPDDLLLAIRIFRSSMVSSFFHSVDDEDFDPGFETPAQLAWLRRRLWDAYWHVDKRRGWRWGLHNLRNRLGRAWAQLRGLEVAPRQ